MASVFLLLGLSSLGAVPPEGWGWARAPWLSSPRAKLLPILIDAKDTPCFSNGGQDEGQHENHTGSHKSAANYRCLIE
jgi:hypothetical protein